MPKLDSAYSIIESVWFVAFTDGVRPMKWWQRPLKSGFRHTFMYTLLPDNQSVLMLNMAAGGLVLRTAAVQDILDEGYADIHDYIEATYAPTVVVPAHGMVVPIVPILRWAPLTCVELCRAVLGIDYMVWTPWQLYRKIIDNRLVAPPFV